MRTSWPVWLAVTAVLAACTSATGPTAPSTASGPAASVVIPPTQAEPPQAGVPSIPNVPQAFDGWTGREIDVNQPATLPRMAGESPIAWKLVDRDRDKGRIENGFLYPTAPGGLTLEGQSEGRKGYLHFAVREIQPTGLVGMMGYDPTTAPVALFPRPVIVRDPDMWARFWPGWSRAVHQAGQSSEPFFPGMAPAVDFHTTALLFVDLELPGYVPSRPIVTHVAGSVIHLAMPAGAGEQPVVWPPQDPHLPRVRTYVFAVPTVPKGASVQFDAFPEAGAHPRVVAAEETDTLPFAVPSPGFNPPAGLTDVSYDEARTPIFRVHLPAEKDEFPSRSGREGTLRSMLMVGDRPAWSATATWTSITEQDAWTSPVQTAMEEVEAAAREAGTLAGPTEPVYWNGVTGYRIPRAGRVGGRPMTGATYLTPYEGRLVRFEVTAFSDVPQPERYAALAEAILADWRWR
jgi:hypothetical protein